MMNSPHDELSHNNSHGVAIEVKDLHVRRGGNLVLPGVSLDVQAGIITGILGPSGSGKTTLLRSIVGVQIVETGSVSVFGKPAGVPSLRWDVAYVTQAPSVYADLTVDENLRYFARIVGAKRERIDETISLVGLGPHMHQIVGTLSGGERSRASLAVALLSDPKVLILDEPTVDVDPILRRDLWGTFNRIADAGAAVLVSSHVMDEASRCHQLVLMRNGVVVAKGTPAELLERTNAGNLEQAFVSIAEEQG